MKKWVLSKHDSVDLAEKIRSSLGVGLGIPRSSQASCVEPAEGVVFARFDNLIFIQLGERFIPFLGSQETLSLFPSAMVDEGAIKYLLNGADVMRPGIKSYDPWGDAGTAVIVKEEKKGRAIAIGQSTVKSEEMSVISKGICLKNLHHVGDVYWNLYKTV
jgi:PUA domain protein